MRNTRLDPTGIAQDESTVLSRTRQRSTKEDRLSILLTANRGGNSISDRLANTKNKYASQSCFKESPFFSTERSLTALPYVSVDWTDRIARRSGIDWNLRPRRRLRQEK
jgi:hypothetical protein